jgi:hypothetical protein
MKGIDVGLVEAHRELAPLTQKLIARKVHAYDASAILNQIEEPIFLNFAHTNEVGDRIIVVLSLPPCFF